MNKPYITKKLFIGEVLSYIPLVITFIYAIVQMATIDGEIPTHFNFQGEIDGYGSPAALLILPAIMLITNLIISITNHFCSEESYNLPFKPKPGREYLMLGYCVLMCVLLQWLDSIFALLLTVFFTRGRILMPLTGAYVVLIFVVIIAVMVKMFRANK